MHVRLSEMSATTWASSRRSGYELMNLFTSIRAYKKTVGNREKQKARTRRASCVFSDVLGIT